MMKKSLYIIVPILTFICGYFIRGLFEGEPIVKKEYVEVIQKVKDDEVASPSKSGHLNDNPKKEKKSISEEKNHIVDSVPVKLDTIPLEIDTTLEQELRIDRDRMLHVASYQIKKKPKTASLLDTLKSQGLNIREESFGNKLLVEFWDSPINFTGYKLGKSKLVLYGINPESRIQLEEIGKDSLRLLEDGVLFNFIKTQDFKPLDVVLKDTL